MKVTKGIAMKKLGLVLLFVIASSSLRATVVVELGFEELVSASALIFTGEVIDVEVSTENDLVYSTVTFAIDQRIKGDHPAPILSLRFLGGNDNNVQLDVAGQYIPGAGDRGLYFVNHPGQHQVNPLTGWSQGYFPLLEKNNATWLDLRSHPTYRRVLGVPDPLADKLRGLQFTPEQIEARVPGSMEFPLQDFIDAIDAELQEGASR